MNQFVQLLMTKSRWLQMLGAACSAGALGYGTALYQTQQQHPCYLLDGSSPLNTIFQFNCFTCIQSDVLQGFDTLYVHIFTFTV